MPVDLAAIYAGCGVDIFEAGVPASDPWMDGPAVTHSMQRALAAGVDHAMLGAQLAGIRRRFAGQAIVVMSYDNIDLNRLTQGSDDMIDGLLRVQVEQSTPTGNFAPADVALITFVSYAMSAVEMERARAATEGYIMLQASPGKTGVREQLDTHLSERINSLKQVGVRVPILPGIGISTPAHAAAAIQAGANGVVIGSACLQHALAGVDRLREFLSAVRSAMYGGR